jgi:hypothetical protein
MTAAQASRAGMDAATRPSFPESEKSLDAHAQPALTSLFASDVERRSPMMHMTATGVATTAGGSACAFAPGADSFGAFLSGRTQTAV